MWCIGALTEEYRHRMYALLELYARPISRAEPVICIDEKSLQLIGHSREPLPMAAHSAAKEDSWLTTITLAGRRQLSWPVEDRCRAGPGGGAIVSRST